MSAELIRELITGMQLAYDALSKGFTDEAMLHLGHHLAKADRACATQPAQPSVSEGSVPEGWRLERDEGGRTIWVCGRGHRVAVEFGEPLWMFCNAMLAAAPQPTTKKG